MSLSFLLLIAAVVCFALAAGSVSLHPRVNLTALGLLAWVGSFLITSQGA